MKKRGSVTCLDPCKIRIQTGMASQFEATFNRVSAVEADEFFWSLMKTTLWGRQVNAWEVRQQFWDKSRQALWLEKQSLPSIPFFMYRGALSEADEEWQHFAQTHQSKAGWVLKINRGMKGVGVHFFAHTHELFAWLETLYRMGDQDFIIQPRLFNDYEYRVTLVGQKMWALLERKGQAGRANFAQGGEAREIKEVPSELRSLVQALTAKPLADVLSIDILLSEKGPVISDINTVPGFEQLDQVTGRSLARELVAQVLD